MFDIVYPDTFFNIQPILEGTLLDGSPALLRFDVGFADPTGSTTAEIVFGTNELGIEIQPGTYTGAERALGRYHGGS